jgi:hypothetical protein
MRARGGGTSSAYARRVSGFFRHVFRETLKKLIGGSV